MAANDQAITGVPGRYAQALHELANEQGTVDKTAADLNTFLELFNSSTDLQRLLASPVSATEEQVEALRALATRADIKGTALNFILLMAKNRRLPALIEAIAGFHGLGAKARGEVTAEVISAEKLSADQIAQIKATLKQTTGQNVQLATQVDPSLLGGLIVRVGSRMMDNSLKTKLQNLKIAMKGTG